MVWVFGIVFLTLVVIFAGWLYRKSHQNREAIMQIPRNRRVLIGVTCFLVSFIAAFGALEVAARSQSLDHAPVGGLLCVMILMLAFVFFQVAAMLCFASLITNTETEGDSKRS